MGKTVLVVLDDDGGCEVYGPYQWPHLAETELDRIRNKDPEVVAWVVSLTDPTSLDDQE